MAALDPPAFQGEKAALDIQRRLLADPGVPLRHTSLQLGFFRVRNQRPYR